ncbi:MAG: glucosamine kinase nucleotide-binding domain-containing protein [Saccharospirillum sp.]
MKQESDTALYMGIDGGGTACRARLADAQGKPLADARTGSANVYQDADQAWRSVDEATDQVLQKAGLPASDRARIRVVAGLAGSEIRRAAQAFLSQVTGFAAFELLNDGQIACVGAHAGQAGVMLVVGTGVIGLRWTAAGWHQVSGWGFPLDDIGSGAWLGQQAVRSALWQRDGLIDASGLTEAVWQVFDHQRDGLIGWAQSALSVDYGKLAPLVVDWYEQADPNAQQIVEQQRQRLGALLDALHQPGLPIVISGGLSDFVVRGLAEHHRQWLRPAQGDALDGALRLAQPKGAC